MFVLVDNGLGAFVEPNCYAVSADQIGNRVLSGCPARHGTLFQVAGS